MTTKAAILAAIELKCLDCSAGRPSEARLCAAASSALWNFRIGAETTRVRRGHGIKPPSKTGRHSDDAELDGMEALGRSMLPSSPMG
jgi:hypothetical protein